MLLKYLLGNRLEFLNNGENNGTDRRWSKVSSLALERNNSSIVP